MGKALESRKLVVIVLVAAAIIVCMQASGFCDNAAAAGAGQPGFNSPNDPVWNAIDWLNEKIGRFVMWLGS